MGVVINFVHDIDVVVKLNFWNGMAKGNVLVGMKENNSIERNTR